jgi:AcrR family transcriptional regulator
MTEYSGGGDPARSFALLWRGRERSARAGRSRLSVDTIVAAAIELADAEGLPALSMRRVADRLGVGVMSLYTYVPGKAELVDVMLDTVYGEADLPEPAEEGWRARLERIARSNRSLYRRHPWLLQVATSRPVLGPNVIAKYDHELQAVAGLGLTEIEMDLLVTVIADYVHGAVRAAVEADQAEQRTGMTDEQWWLAYAPFLNTIVDASRYPTATRVGTAAGEAYGAASDPKHAFEFGLERVLDGIEVFVQARSAQLGRE